MSPTPRAPLPPMAASGVRMAVLVGFLLLAAGCSTFSSPEVEVGLPVVTARSAEASRLEIPLRLEQDNDEPIELLEIEYRFTVEGGGTFRGRRSAEATLAANAGRLIILPAVVRFDELSFDRENPPETIRWTLTGSLLYASPGRFAETLLDLGVYRPKTRFTHRGQLNREDI